MKLLKLASKYKIEITQQLSQGFDINDYKKDYDKNNIENNLFFLKKISLCKN